MPECDTYAKQGVCTQKMVSDACPVSCDVCDYRCPSTMDPSEAEGCQGKAIIFVFLCFRSEKIQNLMREGEKNI